MAQQPSREERVEMLAEALLGSGAFGTFPGSFWAQPDHLRNGFRRMAERCLEAEDRRSRALQISLLASRTVPRRSAAR